MKCTAKYASEDQADATLTGQAAFTPAYASPEQVCQERLTTATDIYSLGVNFYELLTERSPQSIRADYVVVVRRIVDIDPPCPSEALTRSDTVDDAAVDNRPIEPAVFCSRRPTTIPRLRGDLDTIVMTAMQKERPRIAATADASKRQLPRPATGNGSVPE